MKLAIWILSPLWAPVALVGAAAAAVSVAIYAGMFWLIASLHPYD